MFFLSAPQIVVLLGLGALLVGPDKLPHVAATAARLLKQVREFSDHARNELRQELGPEFQHIDLQDLNPMALIRDSMRTENEQLQELRQELATASSPLAPNPNVRHTVSAPAASEPPRFDIDAT